MENCFEGLIFLLGKGVGLKEIVKLSQTIDNIEVKTNLELILDKYKNTEKYERVFAEVIIEDALEKQRKEKEIE